VNTFRVFRDDVRQRTIPNNARPDSDRAAENGAEKFVSDGVYLTCIGNYASGRTLALALFASARRILYIGPDHAPGPARALYRQPVSGVSSFPRSLLITDLYREFTCDDRFSNSASPGPVVFYNNVRAPNRACFIRANRVERLKYAGPTRSDRCVRVVFRPTRRRTN